MGKWLIPGMPTKGWTCIDVHDLNSENLPTDQVEYATCEACGNYPLRFVHTIVHDDWPGELFVGSVCVEILTDDYVNPRRHEAELKRRATARTRWVNLKWKITAKGNKRLDYQGHRVVIFEHPERPGYGCILDGKFSQNLYPTEQAAMLHVFDYLKRRKT